MKRILVFVCFLALIKPGTGLSQGKTVTLPFLIEKISGKSSKYWYKCGSLTRTDRMPGDKRYVFSKTAKTFTVQTCTELLKWKTDTVYTWTIRPEKMDSPTGFHHFNLLVGDQYAYFSFSNDYKTLFIKLKEWNERVCLY